MAESESVSLYTGSPEMRDVQKLKMDGSEIAVCFSVSAPLSAVEICVAKANESGKSGTFTARLYEFRGSYGKTLKGPVLAEQSFSGLKTGEYAEFDLTAGGGDGMIPAGDYLLYLYDAKGNTQFGIVPDEDGSGLCRVYYNASAVYGKLPLVRIKWAGAAGKLLPVPEEKTELVRSNDTWVATDGLSRKVVNSYTDTRRENKTVGLFFHTWHTSNSTAGTRNITSILKEHPEIQNDFTSKLWGNAGSYFWNEPIWGYYRSDDEWVLRKQAELLADAGVDAVFFDNTNGTATFIDDVLTLCKVWSEARADGVNTPKISFMLPMFDYDYVAVQLREIYSKLYGAGLYQDLWFYWKGKPLIVGYPGRLKLTNETDKEIFGFFNYRVINHSQSADNIQVQDDDGNPLVMGAIQQEVRDNYLLWNWISVYPQLVNRNPDGPSRSAWLLPTTGAPKRILPR